MSGKSHFLRFMFQLLLLLGGALGLHLAILHLSSLDLFDNFIVASYCVNAAVTLLMYWILTNLPQRLNGSLGFVFLAGSLVKFSLFFLFFYPHYQQDNQLDRLEFFAFFAPYSLSLFWETYRLVGRLNKA